MHACMHVCISLLLALRHTAWGLLDQATSRSTIAPARRSDPLCRYASRTCRGRYRPPACSPQSHFSANLARAPSRREAPARFSTNENTALICRAGLLMRAFREEAASWTAKHKRLKKGNEWHIFEKGQSLKKGNEWHIFDDEAQHVASRVFQIRGQR